MNDRDDSGSEIKRSGTPLRKAPQKARKGTSGDHPIMQEVRRKLDSIREGTLPELEALNARIDKIKRKSDPPVDEDGDTIPSIEAPKSP